MAITLHVNRRPYAGRYDPWANRWRMGPWLLSDKADYRIRELPEPTF